MSEDAADENSKAGPPPRFEELGFLGRIQWWRFPLSLTVFLLLTVATSFLIFYPLSSVVLSLWPDAAPAIFAPLRQRADDWAAMSDAVALGGFVALMLGFIPYLLSIFAAVALVHRRPLRSLISPRRRFDWSGMCFSLLVVMGLFGVSLLVGLAAVPETLSFVIDPQRSLLFLPAILVLTPLQVLSEEVVFRGYLLQSVRRFTANRIAVLLVPATAFFLMHLLNDEVLRGGLWVVLEYAVISLYLTWLALRGNGLEHAFGFHLGNNLFALLVATYPVTSIPTPTIFITHAPPGLPTLAVTVLICAAHYGMLVRRLGGRAPIPSSSAPAAT